MFGAIKRFWSQLWNRQQPKKPLGGIPLESASVEKVEVVRMGKKDIEVRSLPLGEYIEIIPRLNNIPAVIIEAFNTKQDLAQFVLAATDIVQDEFMMILSQATGLDEIYIRNNVTPAQLLKFWQAFKRVNEYDFLAGEIQAAGTRLTGLLKQMRAA